MIAKKMKQCVDCEKGKLSYLWKSNPPLCRYHSFARGKKVSDVIEKPEAGKLDLWYMKIYSLADGVCAESGRKLKFDKKYCAHLLPKKKGIGGFPYFKYDLRNGVLLDWRFHGILDKGSATQRRALKTWEYISLQRKMLLDEVGMNYDEHYWLNMSV